MEKELMLKEIENEMFLTGFGSDSSLRINPNLNFEKKSDKEEKNSK